MIAPDAGQLVEEGLVGMGIVGDDEGGKVRHGKEPGQTAKRHQNEDKLRHRSGAREPEYRRIIGAQAGNGQTGLKDGNAKGEDKEEVTQFSNHGWDFLCSHPHVKRSGCRRGAPGPRPPPLQL